MNVAAFHLNRLTSTRFLTQIINCQISLFTYYNVLEAIARNGMEANYGRLICFVLSLLNFSFRLGIKNLNYIFTASYVAQQSISLDPSQAKNSLVFFLLTKFP